MLSRLPFSAWLVAGCLVGLLYVIILVNEAVEVFNHFKEALGMLP